ncbi:MAG: hypothetical protein GX225_02430 [Clostridiales bacterium]|nr:hypothetical protein [Clostridiales bacterium]
METIRKIMYNGTKCENDGGYMEGYGYFIIVAIVAVFFAVQSFRSRKAEKARLWKDICDGFGQVPDREYSYPEFERISHFHKFMMDKHPKTERVDDITWNDLDMDSVYLLCNNTYSSVGEEYLYHMLRTPKKENELKKFDKMTTWFEEHEEDAKQMQVKFSKLGRTKTISLYDFIHRLGDLKTKSNLPHYLSIITFFVSAGLLLTVPSIGILAFIAVIAFNVVSYYRSKGEIENYFICFRYLVSIIICSKGISESLDDEFKEYKNEIDEINDSLKSLKKGLFVLSDSIDGSIVEILMDYIRMLFHVDIIKFNSMLSKTMSHIMDVDKLYSLIGTIESAIAVASFRKCMTTKHGYVSRPMFDNTSIHISFDDMYHPLIDNAVCNSISERKGVLLTGSNASGKSTFLKSTAINVILARTIYTTLSRTMKMCEFRIFSSMALADDLENNESYYIVEIKALKRIVDAAAIDTPMICFVDEVLRGTNTVERIAASSEILNSISGKNVLCFAATHDIELTHILEKTYSNYHFEENVVNDDVQFNYKLNTGRATTRNAIKLLKVIGYKDEIIKKATDRAGRFVDTGSWC